MIPNTIHFIFGLDENFGGKPFSFIHFLAVYSAWKINQPEDIFIHYHYTPDTIWWSEAAKYARLNRVAIPDEVFGNPITHFAHKADVLRLQQLQKYGGVYLDSDVICLNPFKPLLRYDMVMGNQAGTGLCNAVILAHADSEFLRLWYDSYRSFDRNLWSRHSVMVPFDLSRDHPDWIHVEGPYSCFYPLFNEPVSTYLWSDDVRLKHRVRWLGVRILDCFAKPRNFHTPYGYLSHTLRSRKWHERKLSQSYCVHLWEQLWWERHLKHMTATSVAEGEGNFATLLRRIIGQEDLRRFVAIEQGRPMSTEYEGVATRWGVGAHDRKVAIEAGGIAKSAELGDGRARVASSRPQAPLEGAPH